MSTVGPLLAALVDDAALFPPGNAPMPDAVTGHRRHRAAPYSRLVGRFLAPASRLAEMQAELVESDRLRLGVIVNTGLPGMDAAVAQAREDPRLVLDAVEIPLPAEADSLPAAARETVAALPDCTAYVEIPRVPGWEAALDVVTAYGRGAKFRTGGTVAEAFPSTHELAAFLGACAERGTPLKCTAGLHGAARHRDATTGFEHHGFLNVLLASHAAVARGDVLGALEERDPQVLAEAIGKLDDEAARRTRELFAGYGSCSVEEPLADLTGLGLL